MQTQYLVLPLCYNTSIEKHLQQLRKYCPEITPRFYNLIETMLWNSKEEPKPSCNSDAPKWWEAANYLVSEADYEIGQISEELCLLMRKISQAHLQPIWIDEDREQVLSIVRDVDEFSREGSDVDKLSMKGRVQFLPLYSFSRILAHPAIRHRQGVPQC